MDAARRVESPVLSRVRRVHAGEPPVWVRRDVDVCTTPAAVVPLEVTRGAGWWRQATVLLGGRRVENFRRMDQIFPSRRIPASSAPLPLPRRPQALATTFRCAGKEWQISDYLAATKTQGLLVLDNTTVVHEETFLGATLQDKFTSWSMAKSVVSLLIGIAVERGLIKSLDDPMRVYLPELAGRAYGDCTVRNLLQMRSGISFSEQYDQVISDVYRIWVKLYLLSQPLMGYLAGRPCEEAPGGAFEYRSSDTAVLGLLLSRVTGKSLAALLHEELWQPLGVSHEASWMVDLHGQELGFCGLNATLESFARIGAMVANGGRVAGKQVVPKAWLDECMTPTDPELLPGAINADMGYQHQWWIPQAGSGEIMARGVYGQHMYIDVPRRIVIVKTSADPDFNGRGEETLALFRALAESVALKRPVEPAA